MTRFAMVAVVLAITAASPAARATPASVTSPKAQRKDLPPGVAEKAGEAFAHGRELDEAGDLPGALSSYLRASQIYPHANTTYNIADVYRRMKKYKEAIEAYTKYLSQAPDAPDRTAVEQLIASLRATPGQLEIEATGTDEQAFVDGEPIGLLPQTVELADGRHMIDVITPISYGWMRCEVHMGRKEKCRPSPVPRMDGNVVIGSSSRIESKHWRETGAFFMIRERFELRHGHYTLGDMTYKQCSPVDIEIPRDENVVTYIFATGPEEPMKNGECVPVSIKQRTIKF